MNYLYLTFGSKSILTELKSQNPTHQFVELASFENEQKRALLDITSADSVFKSGIGFKVLAGNFHIQQDVNYYFNHFMLDEDDQKKWLPTLTKPAASLQYLLGQSIKHDFNFLTITIWDDESKYSDWIAQHPFLSNANGTFDSPYKRVFTLAKN
ncbi:hypothetical protein [Liquorilactobacillus satsumensis]|uniref:hypothetical protein n=1 Tax=Liquorilactobacillus satsumensis TaxID=259059 RepID=UPI001E56EE35|nr:hypothetical protein [Liquorilactobacillus satsumensis]MCC7665725.1 hypothetical protein [Liquorilactobacillus satsumensis]